MYKNFKDVNIGDNIYIIYLGDNNRFEVDIRQVDDINTYETLVGYTCGQNEYHIRIDDLQTWYTDFCYDYEIVTDIECAKDIIRRRISSLIGLEIQKLAEVTQQIDNLRFQMEDVDKLG